MMDILIVENDAIVTKLWSKKLSKEYNVRIADSVVHAREAIDEKKPDVVILDIRLNGPDHSGLDVYRFIRESLNEDTPIIFITGLAYSVDLFQKAENFVKMDSNRGVKTTLLEKPVRIDRLYNEVKSAAVV